MREVKFGSLLVLQRQHAHIMTIHLAGSNALKLPSFDHLQFAMVNSCASEVKEPSIPSGLLAGSSSIAIHEIDILY